MRLGHLVNAAALLSEGGLVIGIVEKRGGQDDELIGKIEKTHYHWEQSISRETWEGKWNEE